MSTRNILLIEDETDIAELIQLNLEELDVKVEHVSDGVRGISLAFQHCWDMVLLDLNLPGCNGIDICKEIRLAKSSIPIILITARTSENDRVLGFDSGADDYITKPFSTLELNARIKAMFRRVDAEQNTDPSSEIISASGIEMNVITHEVSINDEIVELTAKEFDLLLQFVKSPKRVFNRSDLLRSVWGHSYDGYLHTVNTHINRLRRKIEPEPKQPKFIKTVWGVGYKLCEG